MAKGFLDKAKESYKRFAAKVVFYLWKLKAKLIIPGPPITYVI